MTDPGYLDKVLREGAEAADEVAEHTLLAVTEKMGFLIPR